MQGNQGRDGALASQQKLNQSSPQGGETIPDTDPRVVCVGPDVNSETSAHPDGELPPEVGTEANSSEPPPQLLFGAVWRTPGAVHQLGVRNRNQGQFRNLPVTDVATAVAMALARSANGEDAYFACAEYRSSSDRTAANASGAWAFWMDIDCGEEKAAAGKGYRDADQALLALQNFSALTGLSAPTHIVDSGGGLHAYWAVDQLIDRESWLTHAGQLKALCKALHLLADPSRTSDIASVLRVPGTLNYKYTPARRVRLIEAASEPLDRDTLLACIAGAHDRLCGTPTPPTSQGLAANDGGVDCSLQLLGPVDLAELTSALAVLDPDCDEGTWKLRRLAPLAGAARVNPEFAEDLKGLARRWSRGDLRGEPSKAWVTPGTSNGLTGKEAFEKEWRRFQLADYRGQPTTLGTIFHDATQAGWSHGPSRAAVPLPAKKAASNAAASPAMAKSASVRGAAASNGDPPETHHGFASHLVNQLTVETHRPVGHNGQMFVADPEKRIWTARDQDAVVRLVSEAYDGKRLCSRRSDYQAIAAHATSLVGDPEFFAQAPVGLACVESFYRVNGNTIEVEPLNLSHRQRVLLPFEPCKQATPLFDQFLHETFESATEGEEQQQIALVQEFAGAAMLGVMPRYQKAVLFYDPFGRAGKGTLESIIRNLVPPEFITAVSPFMWNKEYFLATLAGARLNVVGELSQDECLPAANFKSVIGGDLQTGRNPAQRPVTFKNEAAHVFMSNHLVTTRDQSEAFFARWLIVEFPNSRLRTGQPLNPLLSAQIVANELPGIAYWALQGGLQLLKNDRFSASSAHDRLLQKWRRGSSSLEEFIGESCDLAPHLTVRRAEMYQAYKDWCGENGRKAFSKANVKELLANNIGLGITHAILAGHEIFRGVALKPDVAADVAYLGL